LILVHREQSLGRRAMLLADNIWNFATDHANESY